MALNITFSYWDRDPQKWLPFIRNHIEPEAIYVADLALKTKDGLWTMPYSVFYTPIPRSGIHQNRYFGLRFNPHQNEYSITNADSVAYDTRWMGIQVMETGEIIFSQWRRDFKQAKTAGAFVDGGQDYFKRGGDLDGCQPVCLKIVDGVFEIEKENG